MSKFDDDIKREVFEIAEEGIFLPCCPHCDILLNLSEVKAQICEFCKDKFELEEIIWLTKASLPEA